MIKGKQFKTQSYSYKQVTIEGRQYLIDPTSGEGYSCGLCNLRRASNEWLHIR